MENDYGVPLSKNEEGSYLGEGDTWFIRKQSIWP